MAAASNGLAELTTSATTQTQPSPKINEQTKNLKNSFSGAPLTLLKNDVFKKLYYMFLIKVHRLLCNVTMRAA
jgi:hypothetical protein